jgi:hypothetical protein
MKILIRLLLEFCNNFKSQGAVPVATEHQYVGRDQRIYCVSSHENT